MGQSLTEIAQTLRGVNKKVQLIYAFNGVGKTRLSRAFKELISPKDQDNESEEHKIKVLYYNSQTVLLIGCSKIKGRKEISLHIFSVTPAIN